MKEFWSERIRNMTPYVPGEQPVGRKFIKLNTNENPYPPAKSTLKAIRRAADDGLRLYPDPSCTALRERIAAFHGLKPEQIFVGNGSDEVLACCFQAFFTPGRPVVFPDVTYSFYPVYCALYEQNYREIPLDESFGLNVEQYYGNNGGVVIANPNAPTGREISLNDIQLLLQKNPDVVVLLDEAYVDFGAQSAVELLDQFPNLVVVRTFSKSRSLAGLRVGYAMSSSNLIAALNCVKDSFNSYPVDRLAQAGAEASLMENDYFYTTRSKIIHTRDRTAERMEGMGFSVCNSCANFLFISHPEVSAKELLDGLRGEGILVRWWDKPRISNHLRVTIGTEQDMETFCVVMEALLAARQ